MTDIIGLLEAQSPVQVEILENLLPRLERLESLLKADTVTTQPTTNAVNKLGVDAKIL